MRNITLLGLISFILVTLVACTSYPLGMSADEWEALPESKRFAARQQQAKLDEAEKQRKYQLQKEKRKQWAIKSLREDEEKERLAATRSNAAYGNLIQCSITGAKAKFGKSWHAAQGVSFELQRNEKGVDLALARKDRRTQKTYVEVGFDGLNVSVCKSRWRNCDTLAGSEREYRRGKSKAINVSGAVQGRLRCSLPRGW
ncbi:hypothetical protein [Marinospirillum insulare]|uniref:Lipoprotein n=1 Tax=Marinospirillum insulare TaxID=217169 RepID=A0ABQ5ZZP3_9GAMM|nr:hypothetical protein [Marinospirillum insulare]GLR63802.1 hypothetical protein GCM10007878_12370 [Marinospirillum insulare]